MNCTLMRAALAAVLALLVSDEVVSAQQPSPD
jgi:hypothetical protein